MILSESPSLVSNKQTIFEVLQALVDAGVQEFCLCPGGRNAPFIPAIEREENLKSYYWYEERSAAFFALGKSKASGRPVAIVTTSGTAAGELLPAAMEAFYAGIPLILITADRPRRFRGSGAPQSAEQVGLYGQYAIFSQDIAAEEVCDLSEWDQSGPAHINVCLEEPLEQDLGDSGFLNFKAHSPIHKLCAPDYRGLVGFLEKVDFPFVVVSTLPVNAKDLIVKFLIQLGAPVFLEGTSGIREHPSLQHLRIRRQEKIQLHASQNGYPIDGVLRIGGIPTFRFWRDLEEQQGEVKVFSLSEQPFSGLSWMEGECTSLKHYFSNFPLLTKKYSYQSWVNADLHYEVKLNALFQSEPFAEPSLVHQLSKIISRESTIYLGNSSPIREWDAFAAGSQFSNVFASRGLNGIDGQISTFFGLCSENTINWGIIGDLTALYDMPAPWIASQMNASFNLVVINNGGGKIFSRMFKNPKIQNLHSFSFENFAKFWKLDYEKWTSVPNRSVEGGQRLIEMIPDEASTQRFWLKLNEI